MNTNMVWQIIMGGIFAFQVFLVSMASGLVLYRNPQIIRIPNISRFLMGAALAPYFIGLYTWLLGVLPEKLPSFLYILPPYLVSLFILYRGRNILLTLYQKIWRRNYSAWECSLFITLISFGIPAIAGVTLIYQEYAKFGATFLGLILLLSVSLFFLMKFLLVYHAKIEFREFSPEKQHASIWVIFSILFMGISAITLLFLIFKIFRDEAIPLNQQFFFFFSVLLLFFFFFIFFGMLYAFNITPARILTKMKYRIQKVQRKERFTAYYHQFIRLGVPICFIALCFILTAMLTSTFISPITGSDASQYASEALAYVKTMNWADVNSYNGSEDGSLLANIHNFAWPAYLANALLHHKPGTAPGYPNDFALPIAIYLNIPLLIMAIGAAARVFQKKLTVACILLFFGSINFLYVIHSASRDAYRLIPLILLVCVLIGTERATHNRRFHLKYYLLPCIIGAFVMMGHPINVFSACAVGLAFTMYLLFTKRFTSKTLILYTSVILGALLGSFQILKAYLSTGKMSGGLIDINDVLFNTQYYNNFIIYSNNRLMDTKNFLERFYYIVFSDNSLINLSSITFSILIMTVIIIRYLSCGDKIPKTFFIYSIVFFNILLLLDIFSWSGFSLTEWYVKNKRYTLNLQLFFAFGLSCALESSLLKIYKSFLARGYIIQSCAAAFLGTLLLFPILIGVLQWGVPSYKRNKNVIEDNLMPVRRFIETQNGRRLLIDNYNDNYYYDNKALSIFTEPARTILYAQTLEELNIALQENNIGAIIIKSRLIEVYWQNSLLMDYLQHINFVINMPNYKLYILP